MKADKILFGLACLGMGMLTYSTLDRGTSDLPVSTKPDTTLLGDSVRFAQPLQKDTLCLTDTIKADTVKLLKKVK